MKWLFPSVMIISLLFPMGLTGCDQPTFHEDEVLAIAQNDMSIDHIGTVSGKVLTNDQFVIRLYSHWHPENWTAHYESRGKWQITVDIIFKGVSKEGRDMGFPDYYQTLASWNFYEHTGMLKFQGLRSK